MRVPFYSFCLSQIKDLCWKIWNYCLSFQYKQSCYLLMFVTILAYISIQFQIAIMRAIFYTYADKDWLVPLKNNRENFSGAKIRHEMKLSPVESRKEFGNLATGFFANEFHSTYWLSDSRNTIFLFACLERRIFQQECWLHGHPCKGAWYRWR